MKIKTMLFLICSLIPVSSLSAQTASRTRVAVIPFWGPDTGINNQFFSALQGVLNGNADYEPFSVDMDKLPPDVPSGGFPPHVCPSPSMTGGAPYALTGETSRADDGRSWILRLYLWEMSDNRLLYSDEIEPADRAECEADLPALLDWLFSWAGKNAESASAGEAAQTGQAKAPEGAASGATARGQTPAVPAAEHWLYAGLRAGLSLAWYTREEVLPFSEDMTAWFGNVEVALYGFAPLLKAGTVHRFGPQFEAAFTTDYAPFRMTDPGAGTNNLTPFSSLSLAFPLLAKYAYTKSDHFASVFGGVYLTVPLGEMKNDKIGGSFGVQPPLGWIAGTGMGIKAGPGTVLLEFRWAADIGETISGSEEHIYRRSRFILSVGYEYGFFPKRRE
jgi:hypothetical protein